MNIFQILEEIQKVDPEFNDRINPRRAAIKNIAGFGSKVAVAALPFALAAFFNKAYADAIPQPVIDILNFALKLEFLESAFYTKGLATTGLVPTGGDTTALTTISNHEKAHVAFLQATLGTSAVLQTSQGTNGTYDFTGGGTFPTAVTNYDTFLALANAFEDTGVRAYKGQVPALVGNQVMLNAALGIHSVEARHAATIRQLRAARPAGPATIMPWIIGANDTGNANFTANYAGEDNVIQGTVTITGLTGVNGAISASAATGAFDEPLTSAQVLALVAPFGVK
jgi:hypothetical protein